MFRRVGLALHAALLEVPMIKKTVLYFLLFTTFLSFSPLFARNVGRSNAGRNIGRSDIGRRDVGRNDLRRDVRRNDVRRDVRNNWDQNLGYYPYYNDYLDPDYYIDSYNYYAPTATTTQSDFVGNYEITSGTFQNGVYTIYVSNGMGFQMSYPGSYPVGKYVDVYSDGGLSFSLVIDGQTYSAIRVK